LIDIKTNNDIFKNNIESISIKKNNLGYYNLYGLIWYELEINNVLTKVLCSIKSNNLIWNYNLCYEHNCNYIDACGGKSNVLLYRFLDSITAKILHKFTLENINTKDVIFEITILNGKKDDFMHYNIYDGLDNYIVKINVAGVKKEDIRIILEDDIIKVKTNPKKENMEDMEVMVEEFKPVKSECEIHLPNILSVDAELEDGVLILTVPKKSKGIKIDIK
jgi:HSP20 family molecular chaperone IbpA